MNPQRLILPLAASIAALLAPVASAQIVWSASPGTNIWNSAGNWGGGNVPDTNLEQAVFDLSTVTNVSVSAATTVQKITFNGVAPSYNVSGSALTIDVNTASATVPDAILVSAGAQPITISNAITLNDSNATGGNVAPTINVGAGSSLTLSGTVSTTANRNLPFQGDGTVTINAPIVAGTGQIQHNGNITINLLVNPTSTGQIRSFSNGGGIRIGASLNKPLGLGVTGGNTHFGRIFLTGNGVVSSGALSTGGGTGTGVNTMDVTFGADISGTGTATHSGTFNIASLGAGFTGTTATVRLDVGDNDTLNMTGVISGTAGGYSAPVLRKQGNGTAILSGANTYTIPTLVAQGTLIVTAAQTGGSAMTVGDGATLGITLANPGATYNTSALTLGSATGAQLRFAVGTLGNPTASLSNAGTLTVTAPSTIDFTGSNLTAGSFPLISYGSIGGLGFGGLSLGSLPFRVSASLVDNVANSSVDLNIAGIDTPRWRGNVSSDWDIDPLNNGAAGTPNWRTLTTNAVTRYVQGAVGVDAVIFDDSATGSTDVNLTTAISPTAITVNNSTLPYTFSGNGRITGATPLVKNGTGTLIIRNTTLNDSTGTTTINAGTIQIGDGVTPGAGSFGNGPVVNNAAIVVLRPDDVTLGNAISGTGTLTKFGSTNLTLTGAITHTGETQIADGTLTLSPTAAYTFASAMTGPGNLVKSGTAAVVLTGDNAVAHTGSTTIATGVLQIGNGQTTGTGPAVAVAGTGLTGSPGAGPIIDNGTLDFRRLDTSLVVPNQISGTGSIAVNGVAGSIVTLTGTNTFTGGVNIALGSLRITNSSALGTGAKTVTVTNGTVGQPGLRLDGSGGDISLPSTISFTTSSTNDPNAAIINEAGNNRIAGNFTLTGGGGSTRLKVDAGSLLMTGNFTPNTTGRFLILSGEATGTITGNINNQNATNTLGLIKDGGGTWTLTGTNNYTVSTAVNAGTLLTTTAQSGNAPVTVADGATFGVAVRTANSSFLTPTLNAGSASGATLRLDTGGFGNPLFAIVSASNFNVSTGTVIDLRGGGLTAGVFPAIDYDVIGNAGFAGLSLITQPRIVAALEDDTINSVVNINVTSVNYPRWNGNLSSVWDINDGSGTGTLNWREQTSLNATRFRQNAPDTDSVIFDDAALGSTNVSLPSTVTPDGILVNNSTLAYTFSGPGNIGGTTGLTKSNNGTLTIANTTPNTYTGVTRINAGSLVIGDGVTAGAGSVGTGGIVNEGTLVLNRPDDFTIAGVVSGGGVLTKQTANTATLANAAQIIGDIGLSAGTLRFAAGGTLSGAISGPGALTLAGGTLELNGATANTFTGVTTLNNGTLRLNKSGVNALGDLVVNGTSVVTQLQSDQFSDTAVITHNGSASIDPGGAISDTIGGVVLNTTGGAQFIVRGVWNFTGTSTVNSGVLSIGSGAAANLNGLVMTGGTFRIAANTGPSTGSIGAGGLTASGGVIEVAQGVGNFDAILNLSGDLTATGNFSITRGGYTGPNLRQLNLGGASRAFNITAGTTTILADIVNGQIVKTGAGTLNLNGAQGYSALEATAGVTNIAADAVNAAITADAAVNFTASQTLASLDIGDGGVVTLGALPAPAPAAFDAAAGDLTGASVQAVPEPGSAMLLLGGIATLLGLRRAPVRRA